MNSWKSDLGLITGAVAVGLAFLLMWGIASDALDRRKCREVMELSGRQTEYRSCSGCYVRVDGEFVPVEAWRVP